MDNLRIDTGVKRVTVNDDPNRVIEFNPTDVAFAERFYSVIRDFEVKQVEYQRRGQELDIQALDANGLPANVGAGLALLREACEFMRERIDSVFGVGTSQKAFGDALTLDMFEQFFEGIMPFIQTARSEKMTRHLNTELSGRVMR